MQRLVHGSRAWALWSVHHMNHILLPETGQWSQAANRCSREPASLVGLYGMPRCVPQMTATGPRHSVQVLPAGCSHLSPFPGVTLQGGSSLTQGCKCSQGAALWLLASTLDILASGPLGGPAKSLLQLHHIHSLPCPMLLRCVVPKTIL